MFADMEMQTTHAVPLGEYVPAADERIVLRMGWAGFETLLALRGDRPVPRMKFLDGTVELMSPSHTHEHLSRNLAFIVGLYAVAVNRRVGGRGSWLLKSRLKDAGVEPDECFVFDPQPGAEILPDLAVEVVWTSGGIDKLEIYRRLGVREVWLWQRRTITVHLLEADGYRVVERSACFPELDLDLVCRLMELPAFNDIAAELQAWLATQRQP